MKYIVEISTKNSAFEFEEDICAELIKIFHRLSQSLEHCDDARNLIHPITLFDSAGNTVGTARLK